MKKDLILSGRSKVYFVNLIEFVLVLVRNSKKTIEFKKTIYKVFNNQHV
jgi:hypothetical protein